MTPAGFPFKVSTALPVPSTWYVPANWLEPGPLGPLVLSDRLILPFPSAKPQLTAFVSEERAGATVPPRYVPRIDWLVKGELDCASRIPEVTRLSVPTTNAWTPPESWTRNLAH